MRHRPRLAAGRARALGLPTRGTTGANRLRRMDNWIATVLAGRIRSAENPLVIDLGYGESPITAVELLARLRRIRPDVAVLGLEIDPDRVAAAQPATGPGLSFARGGFELAGHRPVLVRAANVLRQYPEPAVQPAWRSMQAQLAADGVIVEGTCDELGRRGSWVLLDAEAPVSLTLFCRPELVRRPSEVADRLVKALIHRNVAGQRVHAPAAGDGRRLGPACAAGCLRWPAALAGDVRHPHRRLAGAVRPGPASAGRVDGRLASGSPLAALRSRIT